ncbi:MAG: TfoX/Sxy family protein [Rhodobacteraceae bacterium]|nr:TfoX/Sxy family protein [Paracoccaceae bacterium]
MVGAFPDTGAPVMAHDEGLAETLRSDLAAVPDLREIAMFGGLCFTSRGNMVCGTFRDHGLYRVGKAQVPPALSLPHTGPMTMGERTMGGFVTLDPDGFADDALREHLTRLALAFVATLDPK